MVNDMTKKKKPPKEYIPLAKQELILKGRARVYGHEEIVAVFGTHEVSGADIAQWREHTWDKNNILYIKQWGDRGDVGPFEQLQRKGNIRTFAKEIQIRPLYINIEDHGWDNSIPTVSSNLITKISFFYQDDMVLFKLLATCEYHTPINKKL
jgi:hypothetical protein